MANLVANDIYLTFRTSDDWLFADRSQFNDVRVVMVVNIIKSEAKLAFLFSSPDYLPNEMFDVYDRAAKLGYTRGGVAWAMFIAEYYRLLQEKRAFRAR